MEKDTADPDLERSCDPNIHRLCFADFLKCCDDFVFFLDHSGGGYLRGLIAERLFWSIAVRHCGQSEKKMVVTACPVLRKTLPFRRKIQGGIREKTGCGSAGFALSQNRKTRATVEYMFHYTSITDVSGRSIYMILEKHLFHSYG